MAISAGNSSFSHTTKTISHNNNGDYLVVGVANGYASSATAVTYGGVAMTKLGEIPGGSSGNNFAVTLWGLVAPLSGVNDVVVSYTDSYYVISVLSVLGVDQTTPYSVVSTALLDGAGSTNPNITVTSATGELVVDMVGNRYVTGFNSATVGSGQTQVTNDSNGTAAVQNGGFMSYEAGASSVVMDWTFSQTNPWKVVAVSLKPASAPPPATNVRFNNRGLRPRQFAPGNAR